MALFRREAIKAASSQLLGSAVCAPHISQTLLCSMLALWLVFTGAFLTNATYARKATVSGWLEPRDGVIRVYASPEGKIARLLVNEGDTVHIGQPLLIVNGDRVLSDGSHLEDLLLEEYARQRTMLTNRIERVSSGTERQIAMLEEQLAAARRSLDLIEQQLNTVDAQENLWRNRLARRNALASAGHIAKVDIEPLHDRLLALRAERQSLGREREEQLALLNGTRAHIQRTRREADESLDSITLSMSDISQKIAKLRGERSYIIKSPKAGRISNIQISEGQRAQYNIPLMTVAPSESNLEARIIVPASASGFIQAGQELSLRFDAFPYQKFGTYKGRVKNMSETVLLPSELNNPKVPIQGPSYKMSASLDSPTVLAYGERVALRSGMTLSADITLEKRSLFEWLFEPIFSLRGRL